MSELEQRAAPTRVLVWQWGQRGAGPRFAAEAAAALEAHGLDVVLSLSRHAEAYGTLSRLCRRLLPFSGRAAGRAGAAVVLGLPFQLWSLFRAVRRERPDAALCAMAGYWDVPFVLLLRACGVRVLSIVHEVEGHPGDIHGMQYRLQRLVVGMSDGVVALSDHVARQVAARWPRKALVRTAHPPFAFADLDVPPPAPLSLPEGPLRLLITGRIWGYKGTDMAVAAFGLLPQGSAALRIVGHGDGHRLDPRDPGPSIDIESRWLCEEQLVREIDAAHLVLFPYLAASQSGLIPLCLSRGRPVAVTPVGGLAGQVRPDAAGEVASEASEAAFAQAIGRFLAERGALPCISAAAIEANDPAAQWRIFAADVARAFGWRRAAKP